MPQPAISKARASDPRLGLSRARRAVLAAPHRGSAPAELHQRLRRRCHCALQHFKGEMAGKEERSAHRQRDGEDRNERVGGEYSMRTSPPAARAIQALGATLGEAQKVPDFYSSRMSRTSGVGRIKTGLGEGAVVDVKVNRCHPSDRFRTLHPNDYATARLHNVTVLSRVTYKGKKNFLKLNVADVYPEYAFDVFASMSMVRLTTAAPNGSNFGDARSSGETAPIPGADGSIAIDDGAEEGEEARMTAWIEAVQDDSQPLPENSETRLPSERPIYHASTWGHDGVCPRSSTGCSNFKAQFKQQKPPTWTQPMELFEAMLPTDFVKDTMIPAMNKDTDGLGLSYGELLRWIGCIQVMALHPGGQRSDYWRDESRSDPALRTCAVKLGQYMSKHRFDQILSAVRLTDEPPPAYRDKFHNIRKLVKAFNEHMSEVYAPSWLTCLDESMMSWTSPRRGPPLSMSPP
eukprot:scaffold1724_cov246-Pinguiococcus_pyrenoidosus.AAC.1